MSGRRPHAWRRLAPLVAALIVGLVVVRAAAGDVFHPPGSSHRHAAATRARRTRRHRRGAPARSARTDAERLAASGRLASATAPAAPATPTAAERASEARIWATVAAAQLPENAPVDVRDGGWITAGDLARLLDATKFWRADLRKLELRTRGHRVLLTVDDPFAIVDDRTVELPRSVQSAGGMLRVPVALVDSLPSDSTLVRLVYDARRGLVLRVPEAGLVRTPHVTDDSLEARVVFPVDHPGDADVIGRGRSHFRLRLAGFFVGSVPDSLPEGHLVRSLRPLPSSLGSAFEFELAPEAQSFRILRDERHGALTLVIDRAARRDGEPFAPEGPPGPRPVHVIVLDPGHGGADAGVSVAGAVEKDLTLALARTLARELARRFGAKVVLTRTDDHAVPPEERAERANRAHADLLLSLHFDAAPGPQLRGITAYCPPATSSAASEAGGSLLVVAPWRDVAVRHAVRSRELAEAMLTAFELQGLGPVRLRELLPVPLLGVNAPGLMLECGVLTSDIDRARLTRAGGLDELADAIALGIAAYERPR